MRAYMTDHGLEEPVLTEETGYFQVVFTGPGKNVKRLKVPAAAISRIIPESIAGKLNDRQKKIVSQVLREGSVSTSWVIDSLKIARDTARRDFNFMVKLGIFSAVGEGRATRYVLKASGKRIDR